MCRPRALIRARHLLAVISIAGLAGCGGGQPARSTGAASRSAQSVPASRSAASSTAATTPTVPQRPPRYPVVLGAALRRVGSQFKPVVTVQGQPAVWMAHLPSGVTMLYINGALVTLALHSGTLDAGSSGWRYGPSIVDGERRRLIAAFNGGFKFSTEAGGFLSYGRTASPLRRGLGSIVTYADGATNIGAWEQGVPSHASRVVSVRQNLTLLIDHGRASSTIECVSCWGATLGGGPEVARSALGITADGQLVWAGGEQLSVATLTDALLKAKVVRAVELDINPQWVAGYLYRHRGTGKPLEAIPVVPGQTGVGGSFLEPYSRDFFAVRER
jgi:hypothetical protein